jgi:hypothetical protein
VLESLPKIDPFCCSTLVYNIEAEAGSQPYIRQDEENSQSRLPSPDQVRQWQDERDAIEEEVFAFDGGDLERIKMKTRGMSEI